MCACGVFPPSNLFICRKKVLFKAFALLIIDLSSVNYYRGFSKRRAEEETCFPYLCSTLKISGFVILSLFSCCFSSKISKEILILVRSLYSVERNYDFFLKRAPNTYTRSNTKVLEEI